MRALIIIAIFLSACGSQVPASPKTVSRGTLTCHHADVDGQDAVVCDDGNVYQVDAGEGEGEGEGEGTIAGEGEGEGEGEGDPPPPPCGDGIVLGSVVVNNNLDLQAYVGCTHVLGDLNVNALGLDNLDALSTITAVDHGVSVRNVSASLVNWQLATVGNDLEINGITSTVLGLPLLVDVDNVVISGNGELTDFGGFFPVNAQTLTITGNTQLPQCEADALAANLSMSQPLYQASNNDDTATCP